MRKIHNLSNRALAFTVALAIILSSVAVCFATIVNVKADTTPTQPEYWSGETADKYAGGSGTSSEPYLIENGAQLAKLVNDTATEGNFYKITSDIYLNDTSLENWTETAINWVVGTVSFYGVLDGDNHTISGLYYNGTNNYVGLFSRVRGTSVSVKNLTVTQSSITTTGDGAAAIAGFIYSGTKAVFEKCILTDSVTVKGREGAGGFVAYGTCNSIAFKSCASFATTTATYRRHGSFIGNVYYNSDTSTNPRNMSYDNCIAGDVYSDYFAAKEGSSFVNSYCAVSGTGANGTAISDSYIPVVSLSNMIGTAAKDNMPNLNWQRVWITTENGYPAIRVITSDSNPGEVWTGNVAEAYAGGNGTAETPFLISNGEQLAKLNFDTETEGKYYKLTHDIILNDSTLSNWKNYAINWVCDTASATFKGTLLGDGHTIYGLYYKGSSNVPSLLKNVSGNVNINRLVLDGVYLETSGYCPAAIVGNISGTTTTVKITECYVKNSSISSTDNTGNAGAGGFAGWGNGKIEIEDSAYLGTVYAPNYAGAFIGNCWTSGAHSVKNSFTNVELLFGSKKYINDSSVNNYGVFNTPAQWGVTLITVDKMLGTDARANMPKLDWGRAWKVDTNGGYPLPVFPAPNGTVGEVWTGNTALNYAGGDGTENNPYQIATGEQLVKMMYDENSEGTYYKLIADILLNATSSDNWQEYARNWICDKSTPSFTGTLMGDGYAIKGLYYKGSANTPALIKSISGNVAISRLVLDGVHIETTGYCPAAIVGSTGSKDNSLKITECYVKNSEIISTYNDSGNKGAGGFVGYGQASVEILDSAYLGIVEAPANAGALIGNFWQQNNLIVKNSFTNAPIKLCSKWALNIASENNYGAGNGAENGVILISADKMLGTEAKANMPKLDWGRTWAIDNEGGYPLPLFPDPNGVAGEVWTGNTAIKYNGGDGTKDNPYQIATGEQLLKMALDENSEGTYYKLTYDIKLNDTSSADWKENARNWVWNSNVFKGYFDGNAHTISGLYYNGIMDKVGLFCRAANATIENVIIKDSFIYSTGFATGTLIGAADSGKINISKCYVENGYVESTYDAGGDKGAGGIVGYGGAAISIRNSAYIGKVKAPAFAGAILGNCWIKNNYTVNNTFSNAGIKFCTKQQLNSKSDNNYSTYIGYDENVTSIEESKMQGAFAMENMSGLDWKKVWKSTDSYPILNFDNIESAPTDVWSGDVAESYESGTGTEEDPFIIVNGEQLAKMVLDTENAGKFYKLGSNIKLNDTSADKWIYGANQWVWTDNVFSGTFDGDGYKIEGLYYNGAKRFVGLFPSAADATVKNLYLESPYMRTAYYAIGAVIGNISSGEIRLEQCYINNGYVESTFDGDGNRGAGGLVGYGSASVIVEDSAYLGTVKAPGNAGAIIGNCWWPKKDNKPIEDYYLIVRNSFSNAGIKLCGKQNLHSKSDFNYSTCKDEEKYVFVIDESKMQGASAIGNMICLDWRNVWKTTDSFPVCRFGDILSVGKDAWTGEVAEDYASGIGTESDPYIIKTGEQLAKMVLDTESAGKFYKLANDIKLNDTSAEDWIYLANQWIWTDNIFSGTFDGEGHTIEGLYYNGLISKVGLFCYAKDATVKRVKFVNSYVKSSGYAVGTVVGDANAGTVELYQCYVENGYVESTFDSDSNMGAGGLVGYGGGAVKVTGSAFIGTVKAPTNAGAILGNCWAKDEKGASALVVSNTFSNAGIKLCSKQALNNMSDNNYSTCKDAENYVVSIAEAKMKGEKAIETMSSLNWKTLWKIGSNFPVCNFADLTISGEWTGEVAEDYASGTGTENDPYIIKTGEQLAKMVLDTESAGKFYKLGCSIKLNNTSTAKWTNSAIQWVWSGNVFSGTFDGEGYAIEGLYYNGLKSKVGLFSYAKNATIKNVRFINPYVKSSGYAVGTVVGDANAGTVDLYQCYVENGYVESTYDTDSNKGAGGLVGYGGAAIAVEGSAYFGKVKAPANAGALLGNCWGKDKNGKSALVVTQSIAGASIKICTKQAISSLSDNNYSDCDIKENNVIYVSNDKMQGASALKNMPGLDWGKLWKTTSGNPVCRFGDAIAVSGDVWSGNVADSYAGGDGTEANPFIITNGEQLAKMVLDTETEGKYYKLKNDIKLNDTSASDWTYYAKQWIWTDNVFKGYFDADTNTISGLYFESTKSKVGLFCYTKNATLKRIVLDNAYVHSSGYATGALVGDANSGTLTISECYVKENCSVESTYDADNNMGAGGLVGYGGASIKIDGSAYLGTVKAPKFAGALLGNCWTAAVVTNSFATPQMKFCTKRDIASDSASNYGTGSEEENGVTSIKVSDMKGEAAKKNMPKLNWARSWKTTKDSFPILNVGEYEGKVGNVWSGRLAKNYAGGSGTKEDPYLIATPEQLAKLVANVLESKGKHYKLIADIYLNDVSKENWEDNANEWFWVSTARNGNFNGHFNGDGHVIYGMYLNLNQENSVIYTGLFPTISDGTVIEKTGLSNCHMVVNNENMDWQSYVGGLAGVVFYNQSDEETDLNNLPVISQCFGDSKVILEGRFVGGLVGGGARTANIDNSYFVGEVIGERVGAIIGNTWTTFEGTTVKNCYSATNAADIFCGGRAGVQNSSSPINYTQNYANSSGGLASYVEQLSLLMMRGDAAKKYMSALDFDEIWYALENGTPVLRIFGTTDKFSNTVEPQPIEVSFVSNGGTECEPIYGNPEEKLTLPVPEREGYKFEGWYVYKELDMKYPVDYFPYFNQILYAKWSTLGIVQDFEEYTNTPYDYGDDYEYYRPGTEGYNADYVRSGMSAMHRIGAEGSDADFLINYEDMLEIGTDYKISFWVNTDADDTKAELSIVHEDFPDVFDTDSGVEKIATLKGMKKGEWQEVVATFTAKSKWLAIRTTGNASIYFEDFMVIPTSEGVSASGNALEGNYLIFIIVGVAVVLLAGAAVTAVLILKRRKTRIK